ncbi:acyltransferase [Luteibacter aegosomatis]|uniref:acyltransferase family protein n=1 Tax=Luteibacter aegosomatis TaxID=2911537 RepID=UPI001FFA1AAE|nr:acyltransferase [Luteibacter aegosomatis]UPG86141.1 acyltransferase [Luteibacter aegosomatis]
MHRQPGLDTLRAIAIVWVMLFHSYFVGGLGEGFSLLESPGWMGVDLFFVLSGYLIGRQVLASIAAGGTLDLAAFYRRRMLRILPAFFVVLALYVFWPAWRETPLMQPLWQFPTFTFNLLFDAPDRYAFSHVWSLCVEEHFYLVFPFLALAVAKRPSMRRFALIGVAVVLGGIGLRAWLWETQMAGAGGSAYLRYLYYPTYVRLDGLVAGVALAACAVYRPRWMVWVHANPGRIAFCAILLLGGCLALFTGKRTEFWPCVVGYPLLAAAMAGFVAASSGQAGPMGIRIPGAAWLARASYSLYLSHKGVFTLTAALLGSHLDGHRFLRFAIFAVATLAGGALLHYAVERPFLRWRDRTVVRRAHLGMAGSLTKVE